MHEARYVRKGFSEFVVEETDWPAQIPDHNPMKHFGMNWSTNCEPRFITQHHQCTWGWMGANICNQVFQAWNQNSDGCHSSILMPIRTSRKCSTVTYWIFVISRCPHTFGHIGHKAVLCIFCGFICILVDHCLMCNCVTISTISYSAVTC